MNPGTGKSGSPRLHLMTRFPWSSRDRIFGPILKAFSEPSSPTCFENSAMASSCCAPDKKRGRQSSFAIAFLLSCDLRDSPSPRGIFPLRCPRHHPWSSPGFAFLQSFVPERFIPVPGLAPSVPRHHGPGSLLQEFHRTTKYAARQEKSGGDQAGPPPCR